MWHQYFHVDFSFMTETAVTFLNGGLVLSGNTAGGRTL